MHLYIACKLKPEKPAIQTQQTSLLHLQISTKRKITMAYQKTTIKLAMRSEKDRSKAMQIATQIHGSVIRVEMQGKDRDHLVVIGEFDAANLTESLRKKFPSATLVSVQPITASESSNNYYNSSSNNNNQYEYYPVMAHSTENHQQPWNPTSSYYYDTHYPYSYRVVHESDPSTCSIM